MQFYEGEEHKMDQKYEQTVCVRACDRKEKRTNIVNEQNEEEAVGILLDAGRNENKENEMWKAILWFV